MRYRLSKLPAGYDTTFSSDGGILACSGTRIHVIDPENHERICLSQPIRNISNIAISTNKHMLAAKSTDGTIAIVSAKTGAVLQRVCGSENGEGCAPYFVEGDECVLDGSWNGNITIRRIADGSIAYQIVHPGQMVTHISLDRVRQRLMALIQPKKAEYDDAYSYLKFYGSRTLGEFAGPFCFGDDIEAAALSWDGRNVAIALTKHKPAFGLQFMVIDSSTGAINAVASQLVPLGHGCKMQWSRDDLHLFATGRHRFHILDAKTSNVLANIPVSEEVPSSIAIDPSGKIIALGTWTRTRLVHAQDIVAQATAGN